MPQDVLMIKHAGRYATEYCGRDMNMTGWSRSQCDAIAHLIQAVDAAVCEEGFYMPAS